MNTDSQLNDL